MNNKDIIQQFFVYSAVFSLLIYTVVSCANTTTPPMGGLKDTIPPILLKVLPDSATKMFPIKGKSVELAFNEYVVLKNANNEIYLSPPLETASLTTKIKGKSIIVSFPDSLKKETTYVLNFGNSISDNNEGNPFPSYTYIFSTGNEIDSMLCTGRILNAVTLLPVAGVKAALYTDHSDSVLYNTLPAAIARTDSSGYFSVRNIPEKPYRIFAFLDNNNNNKYDHGVESVAFLDTLFTPVRIIDNAMADIKQFNSTDSTLKDERYADIIMHLFNENPYNQYIKDSKLTGTREVTIAFNTQNTNLISVIFDEIDQYDILHEFNPKRDSLYLWIKDPDYTIPDTLNLSIEYYKTDSLQRLSPETERLNFPTSAIKDSLPENMTVNIIADPSTIEQEGFTLSFSTPVKVIAKDSIKLESKDIRENITLIPVEVAEDSLSLRKYNIFPTVALQKGQEYTLKIPAGTFADIYEIGNKAAERKISLPDDPKLTSITLDLSGVENHFIIDLMDSKREKIIRSRRIFPHNDIKIVFPYLQPGNYSIRIVNDLNDNGLIDTGNLSEQRQPERIIIYTLQDGSVIIPVSESMEVEQSINLKELFQ